jgi:hypothetical protein
LRAQADILREAPGAFQAAAAVMEAIGVSTDKPVNLALKAARLFLASQADECVRAFKSGFKRKRPGVACPSTLEPMLAQPDWRHPRLSAYPSGHATIAFAFAYFIGDMKPHLKDALLVAAQKVASHREVAGLHYPSDSAAGQKLARDVVDAMHAYRKSSKRSASAGAFNTDYDAAVDAIKKALPVQRTRPRNSRNRPGAK